MATKRCVAHRGRFASLVLLAALGIGTRAHAERSSTLVLSCEKSFVLTIDGDVRNRLIPTKSMRLEGLSPGTHELKVEAALVGIFKKKLWYAGLVELPAGMEVRAKVTDGGFAIYGTSKLAPILVAKMEPGRAPAPSPARDAADPTEHADTGRSIRGLLGAAHAALGKNSLGVDRTSRESRREESQQTVTNNVNVNGRPISADSTRTETESEDVRGQRMGWNGGRLHLDDDQSHTSARRTVSQRSGTDTSSGGEASGGSGQFGDACTKLEDCASRLCLIKRQAGNQVGVCTKFCDSFSDCPFKWACERVNNSPRMGCKPPRD